LLPDVSDIAAVRLRTAQDIALQKARATVDERNHLRVWLTPLRYQGMDVWIGQISRDIGVRLSSKTFVTHKIDPDVEDARYYLVQDLARSGGLVKIGWVAGVGQADMATPRFNYTGDAYFTDGIRVVMMGDQQVPLEEIQFFPWGDPRKLVPQASLPLPPGLTVPRELGQLRPSATR
jgi:LssY C-terminus